MPTGSNLTTCLSAMNPLATACFGAATGQPKIRASAGRPAAGKRAASRGLAGLGPRPSFLASALWDRAGLGVTPRPLSGVDGRGASGRALAHVVRPERLPLLRRHLVEQH